MKILVVGRSGLLASELARCFHESEHDAVVVGRPVLDIRDPHCIRKALDNTGPDLVINASAYGGGQTTLEQAEQETELTFSINRDGVKSLAEACQIRHVPLIHVSTDYVFDGHGTQPIAESSPVGPLNVYGQSKWEGEEAVRATCERHLIIRTAWLYGREGRNFVRTMLCLGKDKHEIRVVQDQYGCPTWVRNLAQTILVLCNAVQREQASIPWGTFHFCGAGHTTWYAFAMAIFQNVAGLDVMTVNTITPIPTTAYPSTVLRPRYSVLCCEKIRSTFGVNPPRWQDSLTDCLREMYPCHSLHLGQS